MVNTAVVHRIDKDKVYLVHIKDYGKKEGTERNFWKIKDLEFLGNNNKGLELKVGDAVEFYIPEGRTILASFTILILPLIFFLLSFILLGKAGLESEKIKALLSLGVMILSFYITKIIKKAGFKETLPNIIRKVEKNELADLKKSCSDCGSCSACN